MHNFDDAMALEATGDGRPRGTWADTEPTAPSVPPPAEVPDADKSPISWHLLATATGARFDRGSFDQSARLWGCGDVLLASSHQIVYYQG